ncbi:MAG TPA: O-antigen ligase family protein [Stellaceae bacterium]|jgi:exopolysaccharide production protein ExoQ|nr:O-antigen ligase family protein [Stellaceae bacterium]
MIRRSQSRSLVRSTPAGRIAPHVVGSPRFNRQRPVGVYARRASGSKPPRRSWFTFDSDGFFAFVLITLMLFAWTLGTAGAAAISAMALLYILIRLPQLGEIMAPRAFILIIPLFAMASFFWSQSPVDTLKYSLEFALTVGVALILSAAPHPKAVLWGIFFAFAIYMPSAIIFGQAVNVGDNGSTAFSGLTQSKNLLGDMAASGALVSLACIVASIEDRRPFRALLALAVAVLEIYMVLVARSAGALLGLGPAVLAFIFFLAMRPAGLTMRLITTVFASLAAALMAVAYGNSFISDSMALFDKDPTLTGRTYLWQRAADFIADKPVLGAGFNGFWVPGNLDAEGMWQFAGIATRVGFSFHNTMIELLVNVGWLGVILFASVAAIAAVLLLRRVMTRPTLTLAFWFGVLIYEFVRMPIEAIGTAPFAHPTILLFAGFGAVAAARRTVEARKAANRLAHYRMRAFRPAFARSALRPSRFSA